MKNILITYQNAHLQIIGYGEDHERLLTIIKKLNLEKHVELVGRVFRDELRLRYSSCDVYVSASKLEAIELTPLEAMACEKPAVLFDTPTHRKFISESKAGGIFSSEDSSEMADVILNVYHKKDKMRDFARKCAEKHDWSITCKKIAEIYEEFL